MNTRKVTLVGPWAAGRKSVASPLSALLGCNWSEYFPEITGECLSEAQERELIRVEREMIHRRLGVDTPLVILPSRRCFLDNQSRAIMLRNSCVVRLAVPLHIVRSRIDRILGHPQRRTMLAEPARFAALDESAELKYREAHFSVQACDRDPEEIAADIVEHLALLPKMLESVE